MTLIEPLIDTRRTVSGGAEAAEINSNNENSAKGEQVDPDAALREIRMIIKDCTDDNYQLFRLAELVEGLDEWISKGGFLPSDWHKGQVGDGWIGG